MNSFFQSLIPQWALDFATAWSHAVDLWWLFLAALLVGMLLGAWLGKWVAVIVVAIIAATVVFLKSGGSAAAVKEHSVKAGKERARRMTVRKKATEGLTWIERVKLGL
jgi:uncharacterized protein (DUF58 family)